MFTSLEIKGYKSFHLATASNLRQFTIVLGQNNSGKSNLLELIWLTSAVYNPNLFIKLLTLRGWHQLSFENTTWSPMPWRHFFENYNTKVPITITGMYNNKPVTIDISEISITSESVVASATGQEYPTPGKGLLWKSQYGRVATQTQLHIKGETLVATPPPEPPPIPASLVVHHPLHYKEELIKRLSQVKERGHEETLVSALTAFDKSISGIELLSLDGTPTIHIRTGKHYKPIYEFGSAIYRALAMLLEIGYVNDGIVLIDEFENGIHHSIQPTVISALKTFAQTCSTQLFLSTHSLEALRHLISTLEPEECSLLRTYKKGPSSEIRSISHLEATAALANNVEVR